MPPIGQRGYRLSLYALAAVVLMWSTALFILRNRPEPVDFLWLGIGVGLAIAAVLSPGTLRGVVEWVSRAKDQSSIVEQTGVTKGDK